MNILSPSILSADFWDLGGAVRLVEQEQIPWLHIDVMDDAFVSSISYFLMSYNTFMLLSRWENKLLGINAGVTAINTKGNRDEAGIGLRFLRYRFTIEQIVRFLRA